MGTHLFELVFNGVFRGCQLLLAVPPNSGQAGLPSPHVDTITTAQGVSTPSHFWFDVRYTASALSGMKHDMCRADMRHMLSRWRDMTELPKTKKQQGANS